MRWHDLLRIERTWNISKALSQNRDANGCWIVFNGKVLRGPFNDFRDAEKVAQSLLKEIVKEMEREFEKQILGVNNES